MKVLLIDDHNLFLEGFELILRRLVAQPEIRHAVSMDQAVEQLAQKPQPDIIFTDLALPGVSDIEALLTVKKHAPAVKTIVMSASEDLLTVKRAIANGAAGYIFKSTTSAQELSRALSTVLDDGVYLPTIVLSSELPGKPADDEIVELTPRQKEVLRWVIKGLRNKQIADELCISNDTVKSHLKSIYELLGVRNRTEAVYAAAHTNLRLN